MPEITASDIEKRKRMNLAVWACAYEMYAYSIVSDDIFDKVSRAVNLGITTDRTDLDTWFKENFNANTGMWIYKHPELDRIKKITMGIINAIQSQAEKKREGFIRGLPVGVISS
jgi:hypothetical protein